MSADYADVRQGWVDLLFNRFRIEIEPDRLTALFNALLNFGASMELDAYGLYGKAVHRQLSQEQWAQIIHLATNHETRFYRYRPVIDLVVQFAAEFARPRILSVGCSTGEEPYTFAVELYERGINNFLVHGTDVSAPCIQTARNGAYRFNDTIPAKYVQTAEPGMMKFYDWIKQFVSFEQHNILSGEQIHFEPTIIVTQNMLIYYKPQTRRQILNSLAACLPPGGYLITGPAEDGQWDSSQVDRIPVRNAAVFRKKP